MEKVEVRQPLSHLMRQLLPMRPPNSQHERPPRKGPLDPVLTELEGYNGLGMKKDALRLAKRLLRNPNITDAQFEAALQTLLSTVTRLKPCRPCVEKGYARLSAKAQRRVRFWMLSFYHSAHDNATARRYLPKRFNNPNGLMELGFAWDIWSELDDKESLRKHLMLMADGASCADYPFTRSMLLASLGDYFLRTGEWRLAAESYREIPVESVNAHQAVLGPVLTLCGELLAACEAARKPLALFKTYHDPDIEVPLSDNLTEQHRDIEKQLNALQSSLHRLLGKKRLKELAVSTPL